MKKLIGLFFMLLTVSGFSQNLGTINSQQNNVTTATSTLYDDNVLWYDCNEASDTIMIDKSGNGLHGAILGAVLAQPGHIDTSHLYVGTARSVIPDNDLLSVASDSVTFSAWIYLTNLTTDNIIIEKPLEYRFYVQATGEFNLRIYGDSTLSNYMGMRTNPGVIEENTWHHVLATYNKSLSRTGIRVWVDNIEHFQIVGNATITAPLNTTRPADISYSIWTGASYLKGNLDQLTIHKKVFTDAERTELYNAGRGRKYGN